MDRSCASDRHGPYVGAIRSVCLALLHDEFTYKIDQKTGVTPLHKWQESHARLINRSRETFIEHYKKKYGLPLPIWIASEVWGFGTLSHLFGGMREAEQDAIAERYGIGNERVFASWLRSLNYLRNVCAHHSRLRNRNMTDRRANRLTMKRLCFPKAGRMPTFRRVLSCCSVLCSFY